LPFGGLMAKFATKILPASAEEEAKEHRLLYLHPIDGRKTHQVGLLTAAIRELENEIGRMYKLVEENVEDSFNAVINGKVNNYEEIENREEYIDYLNAEISKYISKIAVLDMPASDAEKIGCYYKIIGDIERIGDHAMNFAEHAKSIEEMSDSLTEQGVEDVKEMKLLVNTILKGLKMNEEKKGIDVLKETAQLEQRIDDFTDIMRDNHLKRMLSGQSPADVGILFAEMVTDFERIGDHALNIAEEYSTIA